MDLDAALAKEDVECSVTIDLDAAIAKEGARRDAALAKNAALAKMLVEGAGTASDLDKKHGNIPL